MKAFCFYSAVILIAASTLTVAQHYPKRESISYEEFLSRYAPSRGQETARNYQSAGNEVFHDSTVRMEQQGQTPLTAEVVSDTKPVLFGYNLFARGGTTIEIPHSLALPEDYRIGPGDNLLVKLWGRVEQEYDLTIDRQGAVFIPKVGEITLWGLTIPEAQRRLNDKLSVVFSDFNLSVALGRLKSIQVYVFGEVKYPGSYSVNSLATLFSTLYLAGGPTERGSLRSIRLMRGGTVYSTVDLYDFLLFGKNVGGMALQSGDVIFVDVVGKRVQVTGAVKRPATYEIRGYETILDVISLAGGTKAHAFLDKVRVDRVSGNDHYQVIDLNLRDSPNSDRSFVMQDGDEVWVEEISAVKQNVIYLEGSFSHPGIYQYQPELTVAKLFASGCELSENAYRKRIDVLRVEGGSDTSLLSIDPEEVKTGVGDLVLKPNDRLIAYAEDDVTLMRDVAIYGHVNRPGEYAFYTGMKISDLIFRAGNLRPSAYPLRVELARTKDGGGKAVLYASLDNPAEDLQLKSSDKVFVRQIPGWVERDIVTIEGEVAFPGKYVITKEMNSLYSLMHRAGGLTDNAFVTGTVFTRTSIVSDLKRRGIDRLIVRTAELTRNDSGRIVVDSAALTLDNKMSNRLVVNAHELLHRHNLAYDVKLADGDHIYIPPKPAGVQVLGAVPAVSTITFQPGKRLGYYVKSAGGFLPNADTHNVQLIRADGTIQTGKRTLNKKIELGDAIFVPTRIKKDRDWMKVFSTTASIAASLATTIFVIDRL